MATLGNILWLLLGGLMMAAMYFVLAVVYCVTIVGIPLGLQLFKLAQLSLWPFGHQVKDRDGSMGCWSVGLNVVWILLGGIELALAHIAWGVICFVTIVGIPFGQQHFKLALLALTPFGKEIG